MGRKFNKCLLKHFLFNQYKKKGNNFYFKSKQVARKLDLASRAIGLAARELWKKGLIVLRNPQVSNGAHVWKTNFIDGGD